MAISTNNLNVLMDRILAQALYVARDQLIGLKIATTSISSEVAKKGEFVEFPKDVTEGSPTKVVPSINPIDDDTPVERVSVKVPIDNWYKRNFRIDDDEAHRVLHQSGSLINETIRKQAQLLAEKANETVFEDYWLVPNAVGLGGKQAFGPVDAANPLAQKGAISLSKKLLNKNLVPKIDRKFIVDYDTESSIDDITDFYSSQSNREDLIVDGAINRRFGFDFYSTDSLPSHIAGTYRQNGIKVSAAYNIAAGDKATSSIVHKLNEYTASKVSLKGGVNDGTLLKGDTLWFNGDTTSYTVIEDAAASAAGAVDVAIYPELKKSLAVDATVVMADSAKVNLALTSQGIGFGVRKLKPDNDLIHFAGNPIRELQDSVSGLSMRLEIKRYEETTRFTLSMLWAAGLIDDRYIVKVLSKNHDV